MQLLGAYPLWYVREKYTYTYEYVVSHMNMKTVHIYTNGMRIYCINLLDPGT